MENTRTRHWDWLSAILLFFMLQVAATRLFVTEWTEHLFFAQTLGTFGLVLGLALGYSQFKKRAVRLLVFGYSSVLIPWQLSLAIEDVLLSERLSSVAGRLFFSLELFFMREPVEDGLFFVAFISTVTWFIGIASGYWWARHENYLAAVLPGGIFTLVIHLYDSTVHRRIWILFFYILLSLFLLGQLYYRRNREAWKERGVFQMQESTFDITRGMMITATLLVFLSWTVPASRAGFEAAVDTWKRITQPWDEVEEAFSNAVEALEAPVVKRPGELFGSQLGLGQGNPLSENIVFMVGTPELPEMQVRYYWRGYVYNQFQDHRWYALNAASSEFYPRETELNIPDLDERITATFIVRTEMQHKLLYTASQPVWVSRPGVIHYAATDAGEQDIYAWRTTTYLSPGEQYQVIAALTDPSIQQLQQAGTEYPDWVEERYLQLPEEFSPRIRELAGLITQELETPYEKAVAITTFLRKEIEYTNPLPEAVPDGEDPLEWVLFDLKQGFCNYYASLEVLMLRSQGIPARMAVGFAQGEFDDQEDVYVVRNIDSHAWPEVYFPVIGWVEFEPTGNQPPLVRPDRPEDEQTSEEEEAADSNPESGNLDQTGDPLEDKLNLEELLTESGEPEGSGRWLSLPPFFYPTLAAAILGLFWILNRRYAVIDQIPVQLQAAYERTGVQAPAWITNWARWAALTPIERAFETINRSLNLLSEAPPLHATPAERANLLIEELPSAEDQIRTLAEQHQISLFTPDQGEVGTARKASLRIWLYTIQRSFKKFTQGQMEVHPPTDESNAQ